MQGGLALVKQSYAYIVGRVRVLERSLLGKSGRDRLLGTQSPEEFYRVLAELGWGEVSSQADVEQLCADMLKQVYDMVRQYTPESLVTDCFLIEYDVHNLKVLFKQRALHNNNAGTLSPNGLIPPELLRNCVREQKYEDIEIPILREAAQQLDQAFETTPDPLLIDSVLDQAMYRFVSENMRRSNNAVMKRYFRDRADLANAIIVLRAHQMGRDADFAQNLLLAGGQLEQEALLSLAQPDVEVAKVVLGKPFANVLIKGISAYREGRSLAVLEKLRDDYLLSLIRTHRYQPLTVMPLVGYLIAKEREASIVRLILSARLAGFAGDQLLERLREDYAG